MEPRIYAIQPLVAACYGSNCPEFVKDYPRRVSPPQVTMAVGAVGQMSADAARRSVKSAASAAASAARGRGHTHEPGLRVAATELQDALQAEEDARGRYK